VTFTHRHSAFDPVASPRAWPVLSLLHLALSLTVGFLSLSVQTLLIPTQRQCIENNTFAILSGTVGNYRIHAIDPIARRPTQSGKGFGSA
jgi:hypothetical protein